MAKTKRYFGRVIIDKPVKDADSSSSDSSSSNSVYIPVSIRHTLFDEPSLREACNLYEYSSIQNKSTILSVNLRKTPYLVRFSITLQSTKDDKIFKKLPLHAVKRSLFQSTGEILNRIVKVKVWKLDDDNYELVQILGPIERMKRILKETTKEGEGEKESEGSKGNPPPFQIPGILKKEK